MSSSPAAPSPIPILLDTDPGGDDAVALLWLAALVKRGLAELAAVTTTGGNVRASLTYAGAAKLLHLADLDQVPLGRGGDRKDGPIADAAHIHGEDGMGACSEILLTPPSRTIDQAPNSVDVIVETLTARPGAVSVLAIGPLTNLAVAERRCPGILRQAREVIIMGGAFDGPGNVTPVAEFNAAFDAEAVEAVLASGGDTVWLPLDVSRQVCLPRDRIAALHDAFASSAIARFVDRLCQFMSRTAQQYGETVGAPSFLIHDALTVAYRFYPHLLRFRRGRIAIETAGHHCAGQTLLDNRPTPDPNSNAWVACAVEADPLLDRLLEDLRYLIEATPTLPSSRVTTARDQKP